MSIPHPKVKSTGGSQFQIGSLVMERQLDFSYFLSMKFIFPLITKDIWNICLLEFSVLYT